MTSSAVVDSPIGPLKLTADAGELTRIDFDPDPLTPRGELDADPALRMTADQLAEYFAGERREFDLPLALIGTPFQREVWRTLTLIPYAETWSYLDVARKVGRPTGFRAVGLANGQNPIPIVVPCHRVVGSNGSLTGYGGGLDRKRALLELEARTRVETDFG